jgi:nitrogen regulatory protein P-II 1
LKKIEAIIRPGKLDDIMKNLESIGIYGLNVSHVLGCGRQKGHSEVYRGSEVQVRLLPKVKVEVVVRDEDMDETCNVIIETARTGKVGDGKIFISDVENAIRIRTGEQGIDAL